MKKILLASTALVVTAGIAAADVKVSGDGRMGVVYYDDAFARVDNYGEEQNWQFNSRIRIKFAASGETDGGMTFGGSIRADNSIGGKNGTEGEVFISSDTFGTLAMGDVDGAAETVVGDLDMISLQGLFDQNEMLYLFGANDPSALYTYAWEGLTLGLSLSDDQEYALGAGWDGGMWGVGLGYEYLPEGGNVQISIDDQDITIFRGVNEDTEQLIGQAYVTFANITLKGAYGEIKQGSQNADQYGVSAIGDFGQFSVAAYYRVLEGLKGAQIVGGGTIQKDKLENYGIGAAYDLGGGASLVGGIASVFGGDTTGDFGLKFAF
ncbi:porin [Fluviibacterium sp. S390]|uniref:porin n=1 Tax=Fluviibacterium sp. S390 TaxID=3415139 RepID=UPI003C7B097D